MSGSISPREPISAETIVGGRSLGDLAAKASVDWEPSDICHDPARFNSLRVAFARGFICGYGQFVDPDRAQRIVAVVREMMAAGDHCGPDAALTCKRCREARDTLRALINRKGAKG